MNDITDDLQDHATAILIAEVKRLREELNHLEDCFASITEVFAAEIEHSNKKEQVTELETQVADLRGELEQAAARETALLKVLDDIHGNIIFSMPETLDWSAIAETAAEAFKNPSATAAALLKRLEFLEQDSDHQRSVASQVPYYKERLRINTENLRGSLQAALTPLEAAADALVPPARIKEATDLVDEALVMIREELE